MKTALPSPSSLSTLGAPASAYNQERCDLECQESQREEPKECIWQGVPERPNERDLTESKPDEDKWRPRDPEENDPCRIYYMKNR